MQSCPDYDVIRVTYEAKDKKMKKIKINVGRLSCCLETDISNDKVQVRKYIYIKLPKG